MHINNYSGITTITIPSSVTYNSETYSVTSIGNSAFSFCSTLTSITIPNSVTSIGNNAFENCSRLTSISIPNSVTFIGGRVFSSCRNLETIIILCEVPPTIDPNNTTFEGCYANIKVPCGSIDIYKLLYPKQSKQIIENFPLLTTTSNNENYGHITIIKQNSCDDNIAQIKAEANKGYHFEKWSDGNTENPRTITVTEDIELSATFELDETPVENVQITSANVYSRNGILHVEGAETDYYVLDMAGRLVYSGRDAEVQLPRGVYVVNVGGEVQKVVL